MTRNTNTNTMQNIFKRTLLGIILVSCTHLDAATNEEARKRHQQHPNEDPDPELVGRTTLNKKQ